MFSILLSLSMIVQSSGDIPPAASLISALPARNIPFLGHGIRGGCGAVYNKNPKLFYVGSSNGGVVKTIDGGYTTEVVFDKIGSCSIGSMAMSQRNPDTVWVGTGDKWQRNSVGMGDGIYKTTDGGKTWQDMGLKKSNAIGQIVIDPTNDDIVMVAVLGSPWGYGPDRGIYKTKDGGKTWRKVLYTNEKCAGNDVQIDPKNPKNMLASLYDHIHYPYGYYYGGPGSGIYRSTDAGETWHKTKGLPDGKIGRINVGFFPKDPKIAAAFIEVADPKNSGLYTSKDGGENWIMQPGIAYENKKDRENNKPRERNNSHWTRPYYDSHEIQFDSNDPNHINLGGLWHYTDDGGKTILGFNGDGHGCWIDPNDPSHGMEWTDANGAFQVWNFEQENEKFMSIQFPCFFQTYGAGYDMRKLYWVMGNAQDDCAYSGPTQGNKGFVSGYAHFNIGGHEAGRSMADPNDWTTIYAQGVSASLGRVDLKTGIETHLPLPNSGDYDNVRAYKAYQKMNPQLRTSRFPTFEISPWDSHTLYFGMNVLIKSTDRGDHWEIISPDLTHNKPEWQVPDEESPWWQLEGGSGGKCYQTINTLCESPAKKGLLWVGTDDGYVWLTKNDGKNWENVTKNIPDLPEYSWCSRVEASRFVEGRCYATFDNRHWFDLKSYIYVTEDFGKTWKKITGNIPDEPCRFIREGIRNPHLLFVGTEFGLHISLDRGQSWDYYQDWTCSSAGYRGPTQGYFPRVSVHDLQIQPREEDLVIASHGRGIWTLPIRPLEEMTPENRAKEVYFTTPGNVYLFPVQDGPYSPGQRAENTQPGTLFCYYLKHEIQGGATIQIRDAAGGEIVKIVKSAYNGRVEQRIEKLRDINGPSKAGLNSVRWMNDGFITKPGDYRVVLTVGGKEYVQKLHVEDATEEVLAAAAAIYPKKPREELAKRD